MADVFRAQKVQYFHCELCDFKCCKIDKWKKHIETNKHKILTQADEKRYDCLCGKKYKHRQSLFKHKILCLNANEESIKSINEPLVEKNIKDSEVKEKEQNNLDTKELIIQLLKQNQELQKTLIEISKDKCNIINNTYENKTFNLSFFLNETCKDAVNISEFVDSITIQLTDLEETGRLGYVEGITRIINKHLNKLDKYKRPIHCSDLKREVLYIKNNNEWEKEEPEKPILKKAIKAVANKNIQQIMEWKNENVHCSDSDSNKNDLYLKILSNSMSGATSEEQTKNYEKIISNVVKKVGIDK
jgi:hypothetical protein